MRSSNSIVLIFLFIELYFTDAYNTTILLKLRMTSSTDKYLNGLNKLNKNPNYLRIDNDVKDSNAKDISIDTMLINIYNVDKVFFSRDSYDITLRLNKKLDKNYYLNNNNIFEKITNNTKISSNKISNIYVYEIDKDKNVDCIVYKKN